MTTTFEVSTRVTYRGYHNIRSRITSCSPQIQFGSKSAIFFVPCELEIWRMTLKNNRAPRLCYLKLYISFPSHWSIQTGVIARKHPIRVKIDEFLSQATLKFDEWPWKTIGHIFYDTSSFMYHFVAIGQFKLEIVRKCPFSVKIGDFSSRVTLKFHGWHWKTKGGLFYAIASFVYHFVDMCEFKLELQSGNDQTRTKLVLISVPLAFDLWPWSLHGHHSCQW